MRPALKSGLLPVWRDRDTLQIGIDPRRAVALSGMNQAADLIGLLDGSRDRHQVIAAAAERGIPVPTAERVLTLLAAGGALDDFPAGTLRELPPPLRTRLAAELATASLAHRDGDGGARSLARRRAALVSIEGERRIARAIARILRTSGVGQVRVVRLRSPDSRREPAGNAGHPATGSLRPAGPGGPAARPAGPGSRGAAVAQTDPPGCHRDASPQTDGPGGRMAGWPAERPAAVSRPDLAILVGQQPPEAASRLVMDRIPHLAVSAGEAIGIVGPLVIPGQTACLRCLDYCRAGNDPCWPLILAQLASRRPDPPACDAALAAAVAAQAAAQALTAIDQRPASCAAANGTLELVLPGWQWRRRTWAPHPACPCAGHTAA